MVLRLTEALRLHFGLPPDGLLRRHSGFRVIWFQRHAAFRVRDISDIPANFQTPWISSPFSDPHDSPSHTFSVCEPGYACHLQLSGSVRIQTSPQTFKLRGVQPLSRIPMTPHRTPHRSTIFCKVFLRMANARRMLCYYLRPPRA